MTNKKNKKKFLKKDKPVSKKENQAPAMQDLSPEIKESKASTNLIESFLLSLSQKIELIHKKIGERFPLYQKYLDGCFLIALFMTSITLILGKINVIPLSLRSLAIINGIFILFTVNPDSKRVITTVGSSVVNIFRYIAKYMVKYYVIIQQSILSLPEYTWATPRQAIISAFLTVGLIAALCFFTIALQQSFFNIIYKNFVPFFISKL